jgi:hypothetical protein
MLEVKMGASSITGELLRIEVIGRARLKASLNLVKVKCLGESIEKVE